MKRSAFVKVCQLLAVEHRTPWNKMLRVDWRGEKEGSPSLNTHDYFLFLRNDWSCLHYSEKAIHPRLGRGFKEIRPKERGRSLEVELSGEREYKFLPNHQFSSHWNWMHHESRDQIYFVHQYIPKPLAKLNKLKSMKVFVQSHHK